VTVGVEGPDWTEIRQGLRAGDTVVTNGSFALKALLQQDLLGGAG
jgi:cobalt-zinc-cadmium efflux system membrane fusion protein